MSNNNLSYVRADMLAPEAPPISDSTVGGWLRTNLLATPKDVILTVLALALLAFTLPGIINCSPRAARR
jgi:general L-amino acid transport system permease protein